MLASTKPNTKLRDLGLTRRTGCVLSKKCHVIDVHAARVRCASFDVRSLQEQRMSGDSQICERFKLHCQKSTTATYWGYIYGALIHDICSQRKYLHSYVSHVQCNCNTCIPQICRWISSTLQRILRFRMNVFGLTIILCVCIVIIRLLA